MRTSRYKCLAMAGLALLLLYSAPAKAEPLSSSQNTAFFSHWMTYYYFHRTSEKMPDYLTWLTDSALLENKSDRLPPFTAFLATVFKEQTPERLNEWLGALQPGPGTKQALQRALWLCGQSRLASKIFKETPAYFGHTPSALLAQKISHPSHMDMMWGAFSASGDTAYVRNIIDTLDTSKPLSADPKLDTAMRAAATWSLISNSLQHERVYRLIRQESQTRPEAIKISLQAILDAVATKRPTLLKSNGEFSAMLVTTDANARAQFTKPSHEGIDVVQKSRMTPGEEFIVKLIFTGMALTEDDKADVTYDIALTGPDGTVENGLDKKGLQAFAARTPTRFMIFDNQAYIKMMFDAEDTPGTYTFQATLHDNVGKKNIALSRSIVLTKEKAAQN